jgi:hypothetical protein
VTSHDRRVPTTLCLLGLLLGGLTLAACGGSSGAGATNASAPRQTVVTATATSPRPARTAPAGTVPKGVTTPRSSTGTGAKPLSGARPAARARARAAFAQLITCMRSSGVNLPAPGSRPNGRPPAGAKTPRFKAAAAKCRAALIAALKPKHPGAP